jgi:hypothetical protein
MKQTGRRGPGQRHAGARPAQGTTPGGDSSSPPGATTQEDDTEDEMTYLDGRPYLNLPHPELTTTPDVRWCAAGGGAPDVAVVDFGGGASMHLLSGADATRYALAFACAAKLFADHRPAVSCGEGDMPDVSMALAEHTKPALDRLADPFAGIPNADDHENAPL